jgi:hypothetical protein
MKRTEMQNLVDSLAQQRKQHLAAIENITIRDLKEMVDKISLLNSFLCSANLTTFQD